MRSKNYTVKYTFCQFFDKKRFDKWTLKMVIVDQSADPNEQLNLNIDTVITPSRFTAVIREDICMPSEPIQINPEKVVNVGVCLEQPTLVILVDVKGYHGKAKVQLIGAILQLVQPFPNHRISIHLGGTVSPKRPSIELDSATPTEVFNQVVSAFKSLNGYNKNLAEVFLITYLIYFLYFTRSLSILEKVTAPNPITRMVPKMQ